jgi:hypothetical protein
VGKNTTGGAINPISAHPRIKNLAPDGPHSLDTFSKAGGRLSACSTHQIRYGDQCRSAGITNDVTVLLHTDWNYRDGFSASINF